MKNFDYFNKIIARIKQGKFWKLINNNGYPPHSLYLETPDYYKTIDMGYKIINKQRIKVKMIQDTAGLTIYDLKDYQF